MSAKVEFKLAGDGLPNVRANAFEAFEALSTPYTIDVEIATLDDAWKADAVLRKSLTLLVVDTDRGRERALTGICVRCEFLHHDGTHFIFKVRSSRRSPRSAPAKTAASTRTRASSTSPRRSSLQRASTRSSGA